MRRFSRFMGLACIFPFGFNGGLVNYSGISTVPLPNDEHESNGPVVWHSFW